MGSPFDHYDARSTYDELIAPAGHPRPAAAPLYDWLVQHSPEELAERQHAVETAIQAMGVTFTVYSEGQNLDRAWPMDLIPRVIHRQEWDTISAGLEQRLSALNHFIADLYGERNAIADGVVPAELIDGTRNYRAQCRGVTLPFGAWAHICGTDLVRGADGTVYVLEDNLRVPSGVSYMLENREVMKRVYPELFPSSGIAPIDRYPSELLDVLSSLCPDQTVSQPVIGVLTPGPWNSAYFEHTYLAQQLGAELVEGRDLLVGEDECVYMRTIHGSRRVHVIYRRVDDEFLDPEVFRPDSVLGVPGLMRAWRAGNVAIANAPGAGVADHKGVYSFVPEIIQYYLNEEPILPNVPTWRCFYEDERAYVLDHIEDLVVKPVNESGGYGMLIGPHAGEADHATFRQRVQDDPGSYIAQPTLNLSTVPSWVDGGLAPRHVDLRPFVLQGARRYCTVGGLSRVAMRAGSLVVNSSQGGGSKDTWVIDPEGT